MNKPQPEQHRALAVPVPTDTDLPDSRTWIAGCTCGWRDFVPCEERFDALYWAEYHVECRNDAINWQFAE